MARRPRMRARRDEMIFHSSRAFQRDPQSNVSLTVDEGGCFLELQSPFQKATILSERTDDGFR